MVSHSKFPTLLFFASCFGNLLSSSTVIAQVIPDNSLGAENSIVTPNVTVKDALADLIEGGAIRENTLFHSFTKFNVTDGGRVYFANPDGVTNILTRVTGNNVSEIFGTLGVEGAANLFLLNPNGIVFGENASLDVNGSFFATTAESFVFGEGLEFNATKPETAPLLTINLTPGLQMGSNSGSITVQGNGHLLTGGSFFPVMDNNTPTGLQVNQGKTLGLIGRGINLTGGILKVPGGNIQLSSVEEGIIQINSSTELWQLDTSQVQRFGDIKFSDKALVDTSGIITGDIQLQGQNISFEDGSMVVIQNLGPQASGKITVNATDSIQFSGSLQNAPDQITPLGTITGVISSKLITESLGTGKGGDISVKSGNLFLADGGLITARTYSNADTGNIDVNVTELIEIKNYSQFNPLLLSGIRTNIFSNGDSGEINVSANNVTVSGGGTISSFNLGNGKGGEVKINVNQDLQISGFNSEIAAPTTLGGFAFRKGNSGSTTINVARLSVSDGANVNTATLAEGSAGQLTVNASESIEVSGAASEIGFSTTLGSDALIFDATFRQLLGLPDRPSGDSGSILVNTPVLIITDGGTVSVRNQGLGNSGSLEINSDQIFLDSEGNITALSASGQGGNIKLNIRDSLLLRHGSAITAETTGTFANSQSSVNGGNITINADLVTLLKNSQINADAFEGNGGNINIFTQGLFVAPDSQISASSQFGLDGTVDIETINSDRQIELTPLPKNPINANQKITTGCSARSDFAIVGKGGLPENPTQNIRGNTVWNDLRLITVNKDTIPSTNTSPTTISKAETIIEAQAWKINENGNLELVATNNDYFSLRGIQTTCNKK